MRGIDLGYFVRRIGMFFLVIFVAASFNFLIPRLAPGDLIGVSVLITFALGITIGSLLAWKSTPRLLRALLPLTMIGGVLPYYLMAMLLLYLFAFTTRILPMNGAVDSG